MKEFVEKLIEELEKSKKVLEGEATKEVMVNGHTLDFENLNGGVGAVKCIITLVKHLAEEYKPQLNDNDLMIVESLPSLYPMKEFEEEALQRVIECVKNEYNDGWISCSERLPENRDWCLAIFKEGDSDFLLVPRVAGYIGKETSLTTNEGWLIIDLEDEIGINAYYKKLVCIAWQPLPAQFKKGE